MSPTIDPDDLAATLRVLETLHELPEDDADLITVKRAAAHMYKAIKKERKLRKRAEELAHDRAVTEATATGSALRIDDETAGIPLVSTAAGAFAGELRNARGCYICKQDYTLVDAFYHWLCPSCAARSHAKRDQRTDLTGKRALLTGGRAKIGMYIALRLLRDGAHTTITTRFPHDAMRRFAQLEDAPEWIDRLKIVGIDLRDPTQVISLADEVAADGPLDILINNACQTVRRSPGAYARLVEAETAPLPDGVRLPEMITFDRISEAHPAAIAGALSSEAVAHHDGESAEAALAHHNAATITALALKAGNASLAAHLDGSAVDAGGLLPDLQTSNTWTQVVDQVDPLELLEVQLCNQTAPFLLVSRLRAAMRAAVAAGARRAYVVNVSAMEGVLPPLQGPRAPPHQHEQGGPQHAHPHLRGRDVRERPDPHDGRRHWVDHRRAAPPGQAAPRRRRLARPARPRRRCCPGLRPDRARRGRRGPPRLLPQGLRRFAMVSALAGLVERGLVAPDWAEALAPVDEQIATMGRFLREELAAGRTYLPAGDRILRAFQRPLADVRVLIVGQDPYPTPGHPIGLSFAVERSVRPIPRSLANIYAELRDDLGIATPSHGDLTSWADAGVMLLNRVLTVRPGESASHRGKGWEEVTACAIRALVARGGPLAAILWGRDAQSLVPMLDGVPYVASAHPSPLSAQRGFFGSRPFSRVDRLLQGQGGEPVAWALPME